MNIPEPLKEFYKVKLTEMQTTEDFSKATISYIETGSPSIEKLIDYQAKVNELSIKSFNIAKTVYSKYELDYLFN